jgi:hypothetical protein
LEHESRLTLPSGRETVLSEHAAAVVASPLASDAATAFPDCDCASGVALVIRAQ